jgi:hypothetical protein
MEVNRRLGVLWTEGFLVDRQRTFVERPRLSKVALALNVKTEAR